MSPAVNLKGLKLDFPTILLAIYVLYAVFSIGMTGLLFSVAVGLVLYGLVDRYELLVAGVILSGIVWKVYLSKVLGVRTEGFESKGESEVAQITNRIQTIQKNNPSGVSSSFIEGFADADTATTEKKDTPPAPTPESKPATVTAPTATKELEKAIPEKATSEKFTNPGPQPFKLELPEETKGGFHIDAGTTIVNALKNLKPDQIEAMTADTQNLINTQKNLMGMLQTMKPMLNDGKQLMETFQQMFGK